MPDEIGPGKGWDVFVDGVYRVSHDVEKCGIEIAFTLHERCKGSKVTLRDNGDGSIRTVLANGTLG